jgi:hypothetical protein
MLARKALAGTAGAPKEYVEDVFSTYLWEGNATARNIVNGIDLSGEGGMVWTKYRNTTNNHRLYDTARGATKEIYTSLTNAESTASQSLTAFNADGFSLGTGQPNENTATVVGWTFRKAKKFFDVVTYTGNGDSNRTVNHNLGSAPGCVIVKRTDSSQDWLGWHIGGGSGYAMSINSTSALTAIGGGFTTTTFTPNVCRNSANTITANTDGATYVAYLFAHDAGGFGDAGSDSIIKCGSYTGNGADDGPAVTLGYEPQWMLVKRSSSTGGWRLIDNMRGNSLTSQTVLSANSSSAESTTAEGRLAFTATGFKLIYGSDSDLNSNGSTYIYIAIRRGPMKTPTSGTDVFAPIYANQSAGTKNTTNFPVDAMIIRSPSGGENNHMVSRLQGVSTNTTDSGQYMYTQSTAAEASGGLTRGWDNTGFQSTSGYAGYNVIYLPFRRAPGFFDVVCWTGTGSNIDITHSLGVTPEFIIGKARDYPTGWICYHKDIGSTGGYPNYFVLNSTQAVGSGDSTIWRGVSSTTFSYGTNATLNISGINYVAYLFASVPGVSKVGTYTGNGSSVTVTTDFQPRFILVKRTDSTGDWIVSDSARGLVAGNDPYLELNTTDAEVTNEDWVDITSTSFTVNQTTNNANVNTATYVYLCIA